MKIIKYLGINLSKETKDLFIEIYSVSATPIKLPIVFFRELEQIISQFVCKYKKNSDSQSNLEKEEWN